jgi:hypothetical protein
MITKYENPKALLFDGPESEIQSKSIDLHTNINGTTSVHFETFISNNFEDLKTQISSDDYNAILEAGAFKTDNGFLNLPTGSDGLRLYYCKKEHIIFVFAYGEFQPTRYKLYFEGAWFVS